MKQQAMCVLTICALSMFVTGCGGGGGGDGDASEPTTPAPPPTPPSANVTVRLTLAARPANVESLHLALTPVSLRRGELPAVAVLTDEQGNELPNTVNECDRYGKCHQVVSTRTISLVSNSALNRAQTVALEHEIPAGDYSAIRIHAMNVIGVRDSQAVLNDGRECEINLHPSSGDNIVVPGQWNVTPDQQWHLTLTLDVGNVTPADCDDGTLDLTAVLGVAESAS